MNVCCFLYTPAMVPSPSQECSPCRRVNYSTPGNSDSLLHPPHAVPLKVNYHVWDFVPVWKWGEKFSDLRGYGMTKRTGLKGTLKIPGSPHPERDKIFIFILWLTHNLHGPLPTWKRRKITQNRFSILCEVSEKIGPQTRSPWLHSTCLLYLNTLLLPHRRAHAPRDREGPAGSRWTTEQRPPGF